MPDEPESFESLLRKLNKEDIIQQAITWNTAHHNLMRANQEQRNELQRLYAYIGRLAVNNDWAPPDSSESE